MSTEASGHPPGVAMADAEKCYEVLSDENSKRHKLPPEEEGAACAAPPSAVACALEPDETGEGAAATFCCPALACGASFASSGDLDSHYVNYHRYQCAQCQQSFIYDRLLEIHLEEAHDSYFAVMSLKQPSFACFAPGCVVLSRDDRARAEHMCDDHHFTKELVAAMLNPTRKLSAETGKRGGDGGKVCHFFNSKAGCRSGSGCRFLHPTAAARMDVETDSLAFDFARSLQVSKSVKFGRKVKKTLCK